MKIETYKCDGCGAIKGATNHWWSLQVSASAATVLVQPFRKHSVINPHHNDSVYLDMCGQDCVNRKLAEVLGRHMEVETKESR